MPSDIQEGDFIYHFPDSFKVMRPCECKYYTQDWQTFAVGKNQPGNAETDFVAFDTSEKKLWLIEVKDYRRHPRSKTAEIGLEFARKCRDTLSLLAALQVSPWAHAKKDKTSENDKASDEFQKMKSIQCILHIEIPPAKQKGVSLSSIKDSVRRHLRRLDPKVKVGTASQISHLLPFTIELKP